MPNRCRPLTEGNLARAADRPSRTCEPAVRVVDPLPGRRRQPSAWKPVAIPEEGPTTSLYRSARFADSAFTGSGERTTMSWKARSWRFVTVGACDRPTGAGPSRRVAARGTRTDSTYIRSEARAPDLRGFHCRSGVAAEQRSPVYGMPCRPWPSQNGIRHSRHLHPGHGSDGSREPSGAGTNTIRIRNRADARPAHPSWQLLATRMAA